MEEMKDKTTKMLIALTDKHREAEFREFLASDTNLAISHQDREKHTSH